MHHCNSKRKRVCKVSRVDQWWRMPLPDGPAYFCGIIHPPPSPELNRQLPAGYPLSLEQLYSLAPELPGAPILVEHAGIHDAVDSTTASNGQLAPREAVIAELHDLGESDATKSPVGTVLEAHVIEPSGALYVVFEVSFLTKING